MMTYLTVDSHVIYELGNAVKIEGELTVLYKLPGQWSAMIGVRVAHGDFANRYGEPMYS